jgi:hypothetical protein
MESEVDEKTIFGSIARAMKIKILNIFYEIEMDNKI